MADLQKPIRQLQQQVGDASREILRIEAHIRRGELRAASARIDGVRRQLAGLKSHSDTALQLAAVGAQLGLLSGGGSWLRGRIPAALLCAAGGWMFGQSMLLDVEREIDALLDHVSYLEEQTAEPSDTESSRAGSAATE